MRRIAVLSNPDDARRFCDHLLTQGIVSEVRAEGAGSGVWVHDERILGRARAEFDTFQANPEAENYRAAGRLAEALRAQRTRELEVARRRQVDVKRRWRPRTWQDVPVSMGLLIICLVVAILTGFGDPGENGAGHVLLDRLLFSTAEEYTAWGIPPQMRWSREGGPELWRWVSPIVLHFGLLHLVMNSMWLLVLGVGIEARRGSLRLAGLVLVIAAVSNYLQYSMSPQPFGGLSGVIFGLAGYSWMKSRFQPRVGLALSPQIVSLFLFWMFFCMLAPLPIANTAHVGGLATGIAIGLLPARARA